MLKSIRVADYMTRNLVTLKPHVSVNDSIRILLENRISGAPVVDDSGSLVGVFSESDCLKGALQASYHETEIGSVAEYMTQDPQTISPDSSILDAAEILIADQRRRLPVVDKGKLVGQISRRDLLRAVDDFSRKDTR